MKIGVVTTSYPRNDGDHAGNFVAAHVAALRNTGHQVDVIGAHTIASKLFDRGGAPDELERGGLRTYVAAARFSAELTREVARRAGQWDLVIAHWLAPSALAALLGTSGRASSSVAALSDTSRLASSSAAALLGTSGRASSSSSALLDTSGRASSRLLALLAQIGLTPPMLASCSARRALPILAIAHGGDIHTLRRLGLLVPTLYTLRARDVRLAFVSAELREIARASAPRLASWLDTAIIQPMGIELARFAALRTTTAGEAARRTVLVVGRLVPVKGIDVAIKAMKLAATDAHLVVAGDGPERARLEGVAGTGGPPTRSISFLGAVDTTTRDRLLTEAACLIIPSRVLPNGRSEGTPMIALEALAAGVPVIASAVGGLRDLPGITRVRPDDPRALAAAIDRALARIDNERGTVPATRIDREGTAPAIADLAKLDWTHVSARLLAHAIGSPIVDALEPVAHAIERVAHAIDTEIRDALDPSIR